MALERREIEIDLSTPMASNTSSDVGSASGMSRVQNFRYRRHGELVKRQTYTGEVACVPLAGSAYASTKLHAVFGRGNEVAALSAEHGIVRNSGTALVPHRGDDSGNLTAPTLKYAPRACRVSRRVLERSQLTDTSMLINAFSAAGFGNQMVLVLSERAYTANMFHVRARVFDLATGGIVDEGFRDLATSTLVVSSCQYQSGVVVTYVTGAAAPYTITARYWDSVAGTWSAPSNLTTNSRNPVHTVRTAASGLYLAFTDNTSGFLTVQTRTLTTVLATHTATHDALLGCDIVVCGSDVLVASVGAVGGDHLWVERLGNPASVTLVTTLAAGALFTAVTAAATTDQGVSGGNGAWIFASLTYVSASGDTISVAIQPLVTCTDATKFNLITSETHYHTAASGSAFAHNGRVYCPMLIAVESLAILASIAVVRAEYSTQRKANIVARIGHDRAVNTAIVARNKPTSYVVGDSAYVIFAGDYGSGSPGFFGQSLFLAKVDLASGAMPTPSVQVAGVTTLATGMLVDYDGMSASETQPLMRPRVTLKVSVAGANTGTFSVCAIFKWVDAAGRLHRSAPSAPVSTGAIAAKQVSVYVSRCPFSAFDGTNDVLLGYEIYATQDGGSVYYLVGETNAYVGYDWYLSTNVTMPTGSEVELYSDGSDSAELVSEPPPPMRFVARIGDRLWGVDAEDTSRIWFTKPIVEGYAPEWNTANTLTVLDECVAVVDVNGVPGLLGAVGVWAIYGDGPNALGVGSFIPARKVPGEVSCVSATSVCKTPLGVVFRGRRSYHLLGPDFSLSSISDPIDDLLRATTDYSALRTVYDALNEEVRFLGEHSYSYVLSLSERKWSVYDTTNQNPVDAAVIDGRVWYLHSDANTGATTVRREFGLDEAGPFTSTDSTSITSQTYRYDGISGLQRLWRVYVTLRLGDSPANVNALTARLYFDGSSTPQVFTWTGAELASMGAAGDVVELPMHPRVQRCRSFSVQISETCSSAYSGSTPLALRPVFGGVPGSKMPKASARKNPA